VGVGGGVFLQKGALDVGSQISGSCPVCAWEHGAGLRTRYDAFLAALK
jgi:hypothetical protein